MTTLTFYGGVGEIGDDNVLSRGWLLVASRGEVVVLGDSIG